MKEEHHIKLKKIRKEKGFTQEDVANHLGISRQAISQWERGISYPDIDNLRLLCQLYQVSINDLALLDEENNPEEQTSDIKEAFTVVGDNSKKIRESDFQSSIEILSIIIILAISAQIPFLGMIIPIIAALRAKKTNTNVKVIFLVSAIAFLIGTYNTFNILSYYLFTGCDIATIG